jgi:hypothetical protein
MPFRLTLAGLTAMLAGRRGPTIQLLAHERQSRYFRCRLGECWPPYAELEVLADGHAAMAGMMRAARNHLAALHVPEDGQPGLALVSQEIGGAVHAVAIEMLEETEGWARLFRVKGVEAA